MGIDRYSSNVSAYGCVIGGEGSRSVPGRESELIIALMLVPST